MIIIIIAYEAMCPALSYRALPLLSGIMVKWWILKVLLDLANMATGAFLDALASLDFTLVSESVSR